MEAVSLDSVREGSRVTVLQINGDGWVRRLYQMGVLPGSKLQVVFNRGFGPLIVRVGDTEISIGRGIARRILVRVDES
jgi:ferrous iron transport protein A